MNASVQRWLVACCAGALLLPAAAASQSVRLRWYESPVDGRDQPYAVVPPRGGDGGPYGLVVGLHGHYGGPGAYCALLLGGQVPRPDFVVACPYGYGDTAFRFIGEDDVFEVMARVKEEFQIDPDRVYVTGASDGGVAAYELALHHPDIWAAAMPLAAYGGMTQFPSIGRTGHTRIEATLIEVGSATSCAANGLHLPFFIANGARDTWSPLPQETVAFHLKALGYQVEEIVHPDLAHDTWTRTYAGGAAFDWFRRFRRPAAPPRVVFVTADPRYRRAFWVSDLVLEAPFARFARVDAHASPGRVVVRTAWLVGLTLKPPPVAGAQGVEVIVDKVRFPPRQGPRSFFRPAAGPWQEGHEPAPLPGTLVKTPGLAGPLGDFRSKPVVFVYGTLRAADRLEALATAERDHWTRGIRVDYPVRADLEVTDAQRKHKTLVLLGSHQHNHLAKEIEARLPVRTREDSAAVVAGERTFPGPQVGYRLIYPSPWASGQYVVMVGGTDLSGVDAASLLPELQPDWVVAGPGSRKKGRGRGMVLGKDRKVLAAGFFDRGWRIRE